MINQRDPRMKSDFISLISPLKSKRTFEDVCDKLKELVFNGTLIPGQQLPSEHALAQLFQVGRQSIREALRVLEYSGFITAVSYTHLRAHETDSYLVCRLL